MITWASWLPAERFHIPVPPRTPRLDEQRLHFHLPPLLPQHGRDAGPQTPSLAGGLPYAVSGSGSEVSRGLLHEDGDVGLVGHHLVQAAVLFLQVSETLGQFHIEA